MAKQATLKGMENRKLADLHEAAEVYVGIRDKRMDLTKKEVSARDDIKALMNKHHKKAYRFEDLEIEIVPKDEKIKVRIAKEGDDEGEGDE